MDRSLVFSILKCEYGWNGCTDTAEQMAQIDGILAREESRGNCEGCAASEIAGFIQDECGRGFFGPRIDGKPNRRTVDRDRGITLQ